MVRRGVVSPAESTREAKRGWARLELSGGPTRVACWSAGARDESSDREEREEERSALHRPLLPARRSLPVLDNGLCSAHQDLQQKL